MPPFAKEEEIKKQYRKVSHFTFSTIFSILIVNHIVCWFNTHTLRTTLLWLSAGTYPI